jgi:hypothetical protein
VSALPQADAAEAGSDLWCQTLADEIALFYAVQALREPLSKVFWRLVLCGRAAGRSAVRGRDGR